MLSFWSLQQCSLGSWVKLGLVQGQQSAKIKHTYVEPHIQLCFGNWWRKTKQEDSIEDLEKFKSKSSQAKPGAGRKNCPALAAVCYYRAEMLRSHHSTPSTTSLLRKVSADGHKTQRSRGGMTITPGKRGTITHLVWV